MKLWLCAQVLDFGLAKVIPKPQVALATALLTVDEQHLTSPGTTLGTVAHREFEGSSSARRRAVPECSCWRALQACRSGPYHSPSALAQFLRTGCPSRDHACVDGLSCIRNGGGTLRCFNSNLDDNGSLVFAFHATTRCVIPDLNHSWFPSHLEANLLAPNNSLFLSLNNGFVLVNDATDQPDNGTENATEDQTMSFYTQADLPFYYDLAQKFAIDDRFFSSLLGPTMPNRSYFMAATSFGHVSGSDIIPPPGGYKPITGTIFDLLDQNGISWADYFQDAPEGSLFRSFVDPHFLPLTGFFAEAQAGLLPQVVFVDPNFGFFGHTLENDEHPPTDIQRGQAFVSEVVNAVRNSPSWQDSVIFVLYDEHGGFYDHAPPPRAQQNFARTPDGISPGQCEDLSNPPASLQPGGGAECASNLLGSPDTSVVEAEALCPALALNPTGPYPTQCASFDQYGFRVPLIAVSPFSKQHYVSHTIADHTSVLAPIEKRFLNSGTPLHLTLRDQYANTLEDLFDFDNSPSLGTPVTQVLGPLQDCTPQ
jgi:phospholipase C